MREVPEGPMDPLLATSKDSESSSEQASRLWMKYLPEVTVLCLCVVLWVPTNAFTTSVGGPGPALYPRTLIVLLAIAMVFRLVQQLRENRSGAVPVPVDDEAPPEEGAELDESLIEHRRVWVAIGFSVLYVSSTLLLGWLIATFVFSIVFLVMAGKRNPLIVVPVALVFAFGFTYVFVKIVYISLPTGSGVFDLITVRLFELMGIY